MSVVDLYRTRVRRAESPDGRDNDLGSGAYSEYQFMPYTAHELAQRTPWGRGLTPEQVKAAVKADSRKADELFNFYTGDSTATLKAAGLEPSPANLFALHRFGSAGGVSLLQAPETMPTGDWARSVNWGKGVSPDAVISQNRLGLYNTVGDLRRGFIGGPMGPATDAPLTLPEQTIKAAPTPAPSPIAQALAPQALAVDSALANLFVQPEDRQAEMKAATRKDRRRRALLADPAIERLAGSRLSLRG